MPTISPVLYRKFLDNAYLTPKSLSIADTGRNTIDITIPHSLFTRPRLDTGTQKMQGKTLVKRAPKI